jgi:dTMP kinase
MRGKFISLEGGEGAGKSTALQIIEQVLREQGKEIIRTREPGGTVLGEKIRDLLLDTSHRPCAESELLLMFAARAQLVCEVIQPALQQGLWVVSDRFTDASFAYQGGGRGLSTGVIAELERWAAGIKPDLTLLLDVDVGTGLDRARSRGQTMDRIESEQNDFFERVRAVYRQRAAQEPNRFRVIDASQPAEKVAQDLRATLLEWISA